ncbi:sulfotransferase domain-containing protein [Parahaliea mediterranea]|uniref:sulfotransferase domain-containing protein n=1 Tax=Parahaliea mediterranea TaxID=651086 RepID=UPI000E2E5DDA|nr:sulfotransferase domain-containing protein [Parahaliea mediterranea]
MKHLHIVGCPRSGTTLLMELLCTCFASDGYCAHERSIFAPPTVADAGLYFSKQPNDIKQLRHIFFRDEQLYVIYLGRDPRAVITSKHRENPGQYFCNYRVWAECDRAARRYDGHPRFLRLRYEDLVGNPDEVQAHIAHHFGFLQQRHRFSEYHLHAAPSADASRAMNGLRAVNPDSLQKWRQHLPRIKEQYQRHPALADDLQRLGYETDRQWLQALASVPAQVYPCRYPERPQTLKDWERAVRVWWKSRHYLAARGAA